MVALIWYPATHARLRMPGLPRCVNSQPVQRYFFAPVVTQIEPFDADGFGAAAEQ